MRHYSGMRAEIQNLLRRLDGAPGEAIESETLGCKSRDPNPAARDSRLREIREVVVSFANARGGTIVLGVADRKRTRCISLPRRSRPSGG